jgi:osmotically-inducible protein OsmY
MNRTKLLETLACVFTLTAALATPLAFAGAAVDKTAPSGASNTERAIKDAWLDGKLDTSLLFNEFLNSFAIDTEVQNGTAYLTGTVESDIDRDLAGEIAKSIKGIDKVDNQLLVDKAKARSGGNKDVAMENESFRQSVMNATVTARVKSKLLLNSNTSGMAIDVDSEDGMVILTGQVSSRQEKELAVLIAGNTEGVKSVKDHLMVEAETQG